MNDTLTIQDRGCFREFRASDILAKLQTLIGIPFVDHGRDETGIDCYGVLLKVMSFLGIEFPDPEKLTNSIDILRIMESELTETKDYQFLDILLFHGEGGALNHVGICLDKLRFLHAQKVVGVSVSVLKDIWKRKFYKAYHICKLNLS